MRFSTFLFIFFWTGCISAQIVQRPIDGWFSCSTEYFPMPSDDSKEYKEAMLSGQYHQKFNNKDSLVIPIVIHNIHDRYSSYVESKHILDLLNNANEALANRGQYYQPAGIDTKIRVCLAKTDPQGNPTSGILHYEHPFAFTSSLSIPEMFHNDTIQWDKERYLNIYLKSHAPLGEAKFPWSEASGASGFSGFVLSYSEVGRDLGVRVFLHELGHYLGLYHTFGDRPGINTCEYWLDCLEGEDMVCDTPREQFGYSYCLDDPINSCREDMLVDGVFVQDPNSPFDVDVPDMPENYMNGGLCRDRFTEGQVERMYWVIDTYRPHLVDTLGNRCATCSPISLDIPRWKDRAVVEEGYSILNNTQEDAQYLWYVNDVLVSEEKNPILLFVTPGLKHIKVEAQLEDENCGVWELERFLKVNCQEETVKINQPHFYSIDSCYTLTAEYINIDKWIYGEQEGYNNTMNFCVDTLGWKPLVVEHGTGVCLQKDTIWILGQSSNQFLQSYGLYRMLPSEDSLLSNRITGIKKLKDDTYKLNGIEVGEYGIYFKNSFIRQWHQDIDTGLEHVLSQKYPNSGFALIDMIDDTKGNTYFLGSSLNPANYVIGKLNVFGKIEWSKKFRWGKKKSVSSLGIGRDFKIRLENDELFVILTGDFMRISTAGEILETFDYYPLPKYKYDNKLQARPRHLITPDKVWMISWMFAQVEGIYEEFSNELRFPTVLNFSYYDRETKTIESKFLNTSSSIIHPKSGEEVNISTSVLTQTMNIATHPDGVIIYWQSDLNNGEHLHHIMLVSNEHEIIWNRTFFAENFNNSDHPAEAHILTYENRNICITSSSTDGSYYFQLFFDNEGNLKEHYWYEQPIIDNGTPKPRWRGNSNMLGNDGVIYTSHNRNNTLIHYIPADSVYLSCPRTVFPLTEFDYTFTTAESIPIEISSLDVWLEDFDLETKQQFFAMETICESTFPLNDYTIQIIDSTWHCPDSLVVDMEICRQVADNAGQVSVQVYPASPLDTVTSMIQRQIIPFDMDENCTTYSMAIPAMEQTHIMVNANLNTNTPYTLRKTFFDGNEQLEYDYTNNLAYLEGECSPVSTTTPFKKPNIEIFPNPTTGEVTIRSASEKIKTINVINIMGRVLQQLPVNAHRTQIQLEIKGVHFVEIALVNGQVLNRKVVCVR